MLFQYRHTNWGDNGDVFTNDPSIVANGGNSDHFRMRLAYIDWTIPSTDVKVRMGRQAVVTPSYAFGSAILDGRADAVTFTGAVNDNISLGFGWMRIDSGSDIYVDDADAYVNSNVNDDADALMLNAEFAYDGFKVAPWAMYISGQENSMFGNSEFTGPSTFTEGNAYDAFVIGASAELNMFDPFVFAVDALYSNTKYHNMADNAEDSFDGFYVGAKASYKFSNGTAALGGWYASGDDYDSTNANANDNGFILLDGGFSASTILYGDNIIGADAYNTLTGDSPFGTWGLIAEYAGFSFIENLTHTARVVYVQGTNEYNDAVKADRDFLDFTEDDTAVEIDFNSTYQIYKNFSATLELGYVFVDQDNLAQGQDEADDIFRTGLTFVYNF